MNEMFYRAIVDRLQDGVYAVNGDGQIVLWNAAAERITGYRADEVLDHACDQDLLLHVTEDGSAADCPSQAVLADGRPRQTRVYLHHKDGHRVPVRMSGSALLDEQGQIVGAIEFIQEMPAARAARTPVTDEVHQDALTELGNRRYLRTDVEPAVAAAAEGLGALFIDVDHFKSVNDTAGHAVGDRVLRMVGQTIAHGLRQSDWAVRWGGDEFLAIVHAGQAEELEEIAERLRALVASSWVDAGGARISVTVSIGAVMVDPDCPLEESIARADQLMYMSKKAGRDRVTCDATLARVIDLSTA